MPHNASRRNESFFSRIKRIINQVISQTKIAFGKTLLRSTLLMIIINFTIQFGYEYLDIVLCLFGNNNFIF